jgi:hypothetical protein
MNEDGFCEKMEFQTPERLDQIQAIHEVMVRMTVTNPVIQVHLNSPGSFKGKKKSSVTATRLPKLK